MAACAPAGGDGVIEERQRAAAARAVFERRRSAMAARKSAFLLGPSRLRVTALRVGAPKGQPFSLLQCRACRPRGRRRLPGRVDFRRRLSGPAGMPQKMPLQKAVRPSLLSWLAARRKDLPLPRRAATWFSRRSARDPSGDACAKAATKVVTSLRDL